MSKIIKKYKLGSIRIGRASGFGIYHRTQNTVQVYLRKPSMVRRTVYSGPRLEECTSQNSVQRSATGGMYSRYTVLRPAVYHRGTKKSVLCSAKEEMYSRYTVLRSAIEEMYSRYTVLRPTVYHRGTEKSVLRSAIE